MSEEFDRLCEAAAGGSLTAMLEMASLHDGKEREAWLRRFYERAGHLSSAGGTASAQAARELMSASGGAHARYPAEPVVIAVATVAVIPFVNTLVAKAGEDGYAAARALVRWLFRRGREVELPEQRSLRRGEQEPRPVPLLIVENPDPKLKMAIWLGVDTSDERLRALQDLDMGAVVDDARSRQAKAIQIRWDEVTRSWKAHDQ
ncbi:hypothetical protein [Streptomyces sp. AcE210]|uniref:hypothetical protein n=1 Tax=Streptomyces sp. AcE210 TaxID=2292703 RepID=UPI000E30A982|nr:hypothetical protein [Streptomyces sp. AcE210]RFC78296.1 hypothetical protein DXZ75_11480 [Streptomyces sp. AcE210]